MAPFDLYFQSRIAGKVIGTKCASSSELELEFRTDATPLPAVDVAALDSRKQLGSAARSYGELVMRVL
jgi:hypothetical protein